MRSYRAFNSFGLLFATSTTNAAVTTQCVPNSLAVLLRAGAATELTKQNQSNNQPNYLADKERRDERIGSTPNDNAERATEDEPPKYRSLSNQTRSQPGLMACKQEKGETSTKEKSTIDATNFHDGDPRGHGNLYKRREVRRSDKGHGSKTQKNDCYYIKGQTRQVHRRSSHRKTRKDFSQRAPGSRRLVHS